ncbi:MAG: right-handed parallel beta-helix repeat-containing protein [Sumerlaeia bacterium]
MPRSPLLSAFLAACFSALISLAAAQTVYVSVSTGSDANPGTQEAPFATIAHALSTDPETVLLATGDYPVAEPLTFANVEVVGGFRPDDFLSNAGASRLLLPDKSDNLGLPIPGATIAPSATLRYLTFSGGFYTAELLDGARLENCDFEANQGAAILIRGTAEAEVHRCRFTDGIGGVEVQGQAMATVTECTFDDLDGRAITTRDNAVLMLEQSRLVEGDSTALGMFNESTGLIRNNLISRNTGNGVQINRSSPVLQGNMITLNNVGVDITNSIAQLQGNTIARNRASGVAMTLAAPALQRNILAYNASYGAAELGTGTPGGEVTDNLFWGNTVAAYRENDAINLNSQDEFTSEMMNLGTVADNLFTTPSFQDRAAEDFRLQADSPARDVVQPPANQLPVDVRGHARVQGPLQDLGAVEGRNTFKTTMGPDLSEWVVIQDSGSFGPIAVDTLAHGFRFYGEQPNLFGFVEQKDRPVTQPEDSVAIVRYRLSSRGDNALLAPEMRMRLNAESRVVATSAIQPRSIGSAMPPAAGADYYIVTDFLGGGLRTDATDTPAAFRTALDMLKFSSSGRVFLSTPIDWEQWEATLVDKTAYDARFTELRTYTFDVNEEGWTSFNATPGFAAPDFDFDLAKEGLSMTEQGAPNCFGGWVSPFLEGFAPGDVVRLRWTISTEATIPADATAVRLRASNQSFEHTETLLIDPGPGPWADLGPDAAGRDYDMYYVIPAGISDPDYAFAFEMFGFSSRREAQPLTLLSLQVSTAKGGALAP